MFQFPPFASTHLCIQCGMFRVHRNGFPHSGTPGSKSASDSPRLFAANHALHRLLAPRHPPYALISLTITLPLTKRGQRLTQRLMIPLNPDCQRTIRVRNPKVNAERLFCPHLHDPGRRLVELSGIEPLTSALQGRRSPS